MKSLRTGTIVSIALLSSLLASCGMPAEEGAGLRVSATFYPLAHFAQQVSGPDAVVIQVAPAGVEPHDFEPTPKDVSSLLSSDILIVNGAGVDAWAEELEREFTEKGGSFLLMEEALDLLPAEEEDDHEESEEEGHGEEEDDHEHGPLDPHVWLDPSLASRQVDLIAQTLSARDPANADAYARRANDYRAELETLDRRFAEGLKECEDRTVVVAHDAFRYLGRRYGLEMVAIAGMSPDEEPSPKQVAQLVEIAREKGVTTVFFETLASPKLAETLAGEIDARTAVLNPLEGLTPDEAAAGKTYLSVMEENLSALRTALRCP